MATLNGATLSQAQQLVRNFMASGNVQQIGTGQARQVQTKQEFVDTWAALYSQFPKAGDSRVHMHTGTGGALLALVLNHSAASVKAELLTTLNNNGAAVGYILAEPMADGRQARYEIAKSGCSTSDFRDAAAHRGLFVGSC